MKRVTSSLTITKPLGNALRAHQQRFSAGFRERLLLPDRRADLGHDDALCSADHAALALSETGVQGFQETFVAAFVENLCRNGTISIRARQRPIDNR